MKRYKLQKDLPTFKVGDEFYLDSDNNLCLKNTSVIVYNNFVLEEFPNILTDWFEEIPENKRWRGGRGDSYYFIDDEGAIRHEIDINDGMDNYRYNIGNYFKTEAEAESYKKYLTARQVLLDDAEGGKFVLIGKNLSGDYNDFYRVWNIHSNNLYCPGVIYFQDEDAFKKSLKEHEEQWKTVRKYEMGEM